MSIPPTCSLLKGHLGIFTLAFLVSLSVPVSCLHGSITSWLAPLHFSEIHSKLNAGYLADAPGIAGNTGEASQFGGHHTHSPGEDIQSPLSQAAPDYSSVVLVPAPP